MALVGIDRGANGNTTAAASVAISPTGTIAAGSLAVLCLTYDNSETGGGDPFASIIDSIGNTWTSRNNGTRDPGGPSSGISHRMFTCNVATPITTGDTITVTFNFTTVAKAWTIHEITGGSPTYVTGGTHNPGTVNNPTMTTGSITSGDMVVCSIGLEFVNTTTVTADADSTNGSWSAQQFMRVGVTTSGCVTAAQRKLVTATATQTYNPGLNVSTDTVMAWVSVHEASPPPPAGAGRSFAVVV